MFNKNRKTVISGFICVLSFFFCYAFTCQKRAQSPVPVIARVGRAVLTLDELNERIPVEYTDRISREQKINYVKIWVDTELMYQQALRQKLHRDPEISARLSQMKKDLLCAEMISRNTAGPGREPVSEEAVTDYYNKNSDRFVRESDAVKYIEIITDDLSSAASIHRQITRDNFQDMAVKYSKAPIQDSRAVPYLPLSALPKKLADAISLLKPGQASEPVEIDGDFRVVMIIDKQPAGTLCSFDEVREEIIGTLSTQIQKLSFDDMLSGLRLKTDYELHVDRIPVSETDH